MKIIAVTGTKGKTTITRILSHVLYYSGNEVLRVDNDGHHINEKQLSTLRDSTKLFRKTPSVCPGKYLLEMRNKYPKFIAVLETSIGCAGEGLGYRHHNVGIFTNVYEDHINPGNKIFNKADLADKKSFILKRVKRGGCIVFNADDEFVCREIEKSKEKLAKKDVRLIPVGKKFSFFDYEKHLEQGGEIVTVKNEVVILKSKEQEREISHIPEVRWTFDGKFEPSVYNLMLVLAGLYALNGRIANKKEVKLISDYSPAPEGGRLVRLETKRGATILIDYAHEKYSLAEIGKLGNKFKKNKLIGVLRLGPDLENHVVSDIANVAGKFFDQFVIFDKIDGILRKKHSSRHIGEMAQILSEEISKVATEKKVEKIVFEKDAIKRASEIAKRGDCVVIISGNNHKNTLEWVEQCFDIKRVGRKKKWLMNLKRFFEKHRS